MTCAPVSLFSIAVFYFSLCHTVMLVKSEDCNFIESTNDKCRSADFITVEGQRVNKGDTDKRIKLPGSQTEVQWYCGGSNERAAWGKPGNQLRVNYQSDGTIQWRVYKCDDLSGPREAGANCAVPETTEFCPKFSGANSSACVFELTKSTSHVDQKTTTVSVEGTVRAEVEKEAGPLTAKGSAEVKGSVSHSATKAKIVTYKSKQYLVIPPGFSFCAFTNNTSVPDVHSATGFRWRCSFPEYIQAEEKFSNGRCTSLELCDVGVCGRADTSGGDSVHMSRFFVLIVCMIAFFRVYL